MNEKDMKQFDIKPKFNLQWYHGEDKYSDGDIEDTIIDIIKENEPEDYSGAIFHNNVWPVYYHLTNLRKNILNWYSFKEDADILEIGCGLGAITNMLCEKGKTVTAVELSKRRATAALYRCREKENLEIIVGNLNDVQFDKKFDYITLIGVLEYQGHYTESENPYVDFLKKIRQLLKPDGKLLLAIENKYGLKYWCGAREDHTGIPFDGMNQYLLGNRNARTFSKAELANLLEEAGFSKHYFYYPLPDYKLPTVIYSENKLPEANNMEKFSPYYIPDADSLIAIEESIYYDLAQNHVFEFFANSFLVECGVSKSENRPIFAVFSSERKREFRVGTVIYSNKKVEKFLLDDKGDGNHIQKIGENFSALKMNHLKTIEYSIKDDRLEMEFLDRRTADNLLEQAYREKDYPSIWKMYDRLLKELEQSSPEAEEGENILAQYGMAQPGKDYGKILENGMIDMIFRNCFVEGEEWTWFDQEWNMHNVPMNYIFFRALKETYNEHEWFEKVIPLSDVIIRYGLQDCLKEFVFLEKKWIPEVIDDDIFASGAKYRKVSSEALLNNITKLMQKRATETTGSKELNNFVADINGLLKEKRYEDLAAYYGELTKKYAALPEAAQFGQIVELHNLQKEFGDTTVLTRGTSVNEVFSFYASFLSVIAGANESKNREEPAEWAELLTFIEQQKITAYEILTVCAYNRLQEMEQFMDVLGLALYQAGNSSLGIRLMELYMDIYEEADDIAIDLAYIFYREQRKDKMLYYMDKIRKNDKEYEELRKLYSEE